MPTEWPTQKSRNIQSSKTEQGRNKKSEQMTRNNKVELVIKKLAKKKKVQDEMDSQENSTRHLRKS